MWVSEALTQFMLMYFSKTDRPFEKQLPSLTINRNQVDPGFCLIMLKMNAAYITVACDFAISSDYRQKRPFCKMAAMQEGL